MKKLGNPFKQSVRYIIQLLFVLKIPNIYKYKDLYYNQNYKIYK